MLLKRDKIGYTVIRRVCGREYIFPLGSYAYRELLAAEGQESGSIRAPRGILSEKKSRV